MMKRCDDKRAIVGGQSPTDNLVERRVDDIVVRQHRPLGTASGAGGVHNQQWVIGTRSRAGSVSAADASNAS